MSLNLQVVTPQGIVMSAADVESVSAPAASGQIAILPTHVNLLTLLTEGIVLIRTADEDRLLAIGGGYMETDGKHVRILVSKAYGQDEIDAKLTEDAIQKARDVLANTKDRVERAEALRLLSQSHVDLKLLKMRPGRRRSGAIKPEQHS